MEAGRLRAVHAVLLRRRREQFPERLTGGSQDNGCLRSWDYPTNPGDPDNWNSFGCGDGEYTLMDPSDNGIYYGCSQYGSCIRRYDGPLPHR